MVKVNVRRDETGAAEGAENDVNLRSTCGFVYRLLRTVNTLTQ